MLPSFKDSSAQDASLTGPLSITFADVDFHLFSIMASLALQLSGLDMSVKKTIEKINVRVLPKMLHSAKV